MKFYEKLIHKTSFGNIKESKACGKRRQECERNDEERKVKEHTNWCILGYVIALEKTWK